MPISHKRKCIFVHIPKTGGSSVEEVLGMREPFLSQNRDGLFGYIDEAEYKKKHYLSHFYQHLTMQEISDLLPEGIFSNYFKFTFIRNPWDRVVSQYFDITYSMPLGIGNTTFKDFVYSLANVNHIHILPQHKFITDNQDNIIVDFVGRYEDLDKDFRKVCISLGVTPVSLPYIHLSVRKHYSYYYTNETKEIIARLYKRDIELFGYEFERGHHYFQVKKTMFMWRKRAVRMIGRFMVPVLAYIARAT